MQNFEIMTLEAQKHLTLLEKGDFNAFQTFDDSPQGRKSLTKQLFGSFDENKDELEHLNRLGAGVFVMVNESQTKSTKAEAVTATKAFFADSDNGAVANFPLEPTFEVKTAHGYHYYWVLDNSEPIENFEQIQGQIAYDLQTDPAVKNRNRIMRLAGFYHQKDPSNPILVTLERVSDKKYSRKTIEETFKVVAIPNSPSIGGKWEVGTRNTNLYKYIKQNDISLSPDINYADYLNFVWEANIKFCIEPLDEIEIRQLSYPNYKKFKERFKGLCAIAPMLSELEEMYFAEKVSLVESLIFKRQISIIGARPKVGKSTLIRYMAKCLVDSDEFLGRKSYGGKVLYLALEELLEDATQDFKDMKVLNKDNIRITTLSNCNKKEEYLECFENLAMTFKPDLIVIDTMVHLLGIKDISDYAETSLALKHFRNFATNNNCHILFIHHNRKGDSNGNESLLGSTGIAGAVDIIFDVKKDDSGKRFFCSDGRSSQKHIEKTALIFDEATKSFSLDGNYHNSNLEDKILEAIKLNELQSIEQIRTKSGGKSETIRKTVNDLMVRGLIEKSSKVYKIVTEKEVANTSKVGIGLVAPEGIDSDVIETSVLGQNLEEEA